MPQQLIFTSAVRGIAPGSSGYCTVARSVDMREGLVSRLEQLSVYQHSQNGANSMVLSHRIISLRGTIFHVLTRTVDAGLDYTNRTNFIAHHVVFQPHELHGACSPADFILYWPGWLSVWEGDPGWTDDQAASLHDVQNTTSLPAENWAGWSGHAGNASLLFESGKARDVALVAEPGQESALVYLFAESLLLLNDDRNGKGSQWQIPFTTFFQSKDEVADFRWRGVWPEVNRTKAERGALVLDLRNPSSFPLTTGPLAELASTGIAPKPVLSPEIAPVAQTQPAQTEEIAAVSIPKSRQPRTDTVSQLSRKKRQPEYIVEEREEDWQSWFWKWKWVVFGALAVIAMAVGMAVAMLTGPRIESSGEKVGQELPDRQKPSPFTPPPATSIPQQNSLQSPLPDKPFAASTNATPASPSPPTALTATQSTLKNDSGTTFKASSATNAPTALSSQQPTTNAPPMVQLERFDKTSKTNSVSDVPPALPSKEDSQQLNLPDSFPKGEVYIIVKSKEYLGEVTLSPALSVRLLKLCQSATPFTVLRSTSLGASSPKVENLRPLSSSGAFRLPTDKDKSGFLVVNNGALSFQSTDPSETYSLKFQDKDKPVYLLITDQGTLSSKFTLSKSLLDNEPRERSTSISVNSSFKKVLNDWHLSGPDGKDYSLSLRITPYGTTNIVTPDPFTQSWKESANKAAEDLQNAKATEAKLQSLKDQIDKIDKISFSDLGSTSSLTLDRDLMTLSAFLNKGRPKDDAPPLIQYAKAVLSSLKCVYSNTIKFAVPPDPPSSDPASWKKWLTDQEGSVTAQSKSQVKSLTGGPSQEKGLNDAAVLFDKCWDKNFKSNSDLDSLLKLSSTAPPDFSEVKSEWQSAESSIKTSNASSQFDISHADPIEIVGTLQTGGNPIPVIVFKD